MTRRVAGDRGRRRTARRILLLGGARSGKSQLAEELLDRGPAQVRYVATGPVPGPDDTEWSARVQRHRQRRPAGWATLETRDLEPLLLQPGPPLLIDCLSTWLSGVMDDCDFWTGGPTAQRVLRQRTDDLLAAWRRSRNHVLAVSSEVGLGIVPATESGRRYRDELGLLNARIAAGADEVWFVVAGLPQQLKSGR